MAEEQGGVVKVLAENGRFHLGVNTLANLKDVHPTLVAVAKRAIQLTTVDFCVIPGGGARSYAAAAANAEKGVGIKNSLHIRQHDGYAHAMDLVAYVGKPTWAPVSLYHEIRDAVKQAAAELGVPIQHGATFPRPDWPHWQIPYLPNRVKEAVEEMNNIRAALGLEAIT